MARSWGRSRTKNGPFTAILISHSRGTHLIAMYESNCSVRDNSHNIYSWHISCWLSRLPLMLYVAWWGIPGKRRGSISTSKTLQEQNPYAKGDWVGRNRLLLKQTLQKLDSYTNARSKWAGAAVKKYANRQRAPLAKFLSNQSEACYHREINTLSLIKHRVLSILTFSLMNL